jgi:septal ring factor EnvC (AmiA/AmiB activator)
MFDRIVNVLSFLCQSIQFLNFGRNSVEIQTEEQTDLLEVVIEEKRKLEADVLSYSEMNNVLKLQILSAEEQNRKLSEIIASITAQRDELQTRVMLQEQQIQLMQQKIQTTEEALRTTFRQLKQLNNDYETLEDIYQQHADELEECRRMNKNYMMEICVLQKQLEYSKQLEASFSVTTASRPVSPLSVGSIGATINLGENSPLSTGSSCFSPNSPSREVNAVAGCSPLSDITNLKGTCSRPSTPQQRSLKLIRPRVSGRPSLPNHVEELFH